MRLLRRNALGVYAVYAAAIVSGLVVTPVVVHPPGNTRYGAWPFVGEDVFSHTLSQPRETQPPATRITLLYLDADPLEVLDGISARESEWRKAGRTRDLSGVEDIRFAALYRTIVPWEWDWFG